MFTLFCIAFGVEGAGGSIPAFIFWLIVCALLDWLMIMIFRGCIIAMENQHTATTTKTTPKTTYSTTRVTKVTTPKTHGITTTSTTQKRCSNCGCYVHVSANGAYECGYCANYYGGNK